MKQKHDVLVVNRAYCPIHIITWQKALALLYKDHAKALDRDFISYKFSDWVEFSIKNADDYSKIKTVSYHIAIPEILALTIFDKLPQRDVKYSRQNVFIRDNYTCQYCGKAFKKHQLTVDHVIPESRGGKTTWDNIVSCCRKCNARKDDYYLHDATKRYPVLKLKRIPVKPKWFSPLAGIKQSRIDLCPSWDHYMKKIDITSTEDIS